MTTLLRLAAVVGVAGACSVAAAQRIDKTGSARRDLERAIDALGPDQADEFAKLKLQLAEMDGAIQGGLRGPGPANDTCAGAIDVGITAGGTVTVNADNTGATADAGMPGCGTTSTSQSSGHLGVWYKLIGTGNFVTVSSCQQATDFVMRAYCGGCGTLTCVGFDDDGCVTNSLAPSLGFCTTAGQEYLILISRFGTTATATPFAFTVVDNGTPCAAVCGAPANDNCSSAPVMTIPSTVAGNLAAATFDAPATGCGVATTDLDVWYRVTGNGTILRAATCNALTGSNTEIGVYTGVCGSLTCVSNNAVTAGCANNARDDNALVDWVAANGTDYYVRVFSDANGAGSYQLSVTSIGVPAANDACASATPVAIGSSANFNNIGSTADAGLPCGGTNGSGVWFTFTGNGHALSVSTCGAGTTFNTKLTVFNGAGGCGALTCVETNATASPACTPSTAATVNMCSQAGVPYYVLVSGDTTGFGNFDLSVTDVGACAPNDLCSLAQVVSVPSTTPGNNIGSTNDPGLPTCTALSTFNNGVWYRFTGNGNRIRVSTCDAATQLNTRVYVYTSPDCFNFTCVAANATASPACAAQSTAATVTFCSTAAQDYYVLVTNDTSGTGAFVLHVDDLGPIGCQPTGACCNGTTCTITTAALCASGGGSYQGDNSACTPGQQQPNTAIPDATPAGVDITMVIPPGAPTITDLNVSLIIAHTWQGDVRVTLTHQDTATSVVLIDRPGVPQDSTVGFLNDNFGDPTTNTPFVLDDSAAGRYDSAPNGTVPTGGINNVTGSWLPEQPLSAFNGQSMSGTWVLNVSDNASSDLGTVAFWSLDSTPGLPTACQVSGPDCFSTGAAGPNGACARPTHARPTNAGHFTRGGPDGAADSTQCVGDWDGDGCVLPSDVAGFVASWFFSAQNPGNLDGDIDCNNAAEPADVAAFVGSWFSGVTNPASVGC